MVKNVDILACTAPLVALALVLACAAPAPPSPSPSIAAVPATVAATPSEAPTSEPTPSAAPYTGWTVTPRVDGGATEMSRVVRWREELLAIGVNAGSDGTRNPVIEASSDGRTWSIAADPAELGGGASTIKEIAANDDGIVVVGHSGSNTLAATAWYSADGDQWARALLPGGMGTDLIGVAWSNGVWIAIGTAFGPGEAINGPRAWQSTDGRTWSQVTSIETRGVWSSFDSLLAAPGKFLAAGTVFTDHPAGVVWASIDGSTWKIVALLPSVLAIHRLRLVRGEILALFLEPAAAAPRGLIGLASATGSTWSSMLIPEFSIGFDVAEVPAGLLLVGRSSKDEQPMKVALSDGDVAVWRVQPDEPLFSDAGVGSLAEAPDGHHLVGVGGSLDHESTFLLPLP